MSNPQLEELMQELNDKMYYYFSQHISLLGGEKGPDNEVCTSRFRWKPPTSEEFKDFLKRNKGKIQQVIAQL